MTAMNNPIGSGLINIIPTKDGKLILEQIRLFDQGMRTPAVGADYVNWITTPTNLNLIHKLLIDNLNIPPKILSIRRASLNRTQTAVLLVRAIEMAVKRVCNI